MNNAGRFDTPCKLWEYTLEQDEYGQEHKTWTSPAGSPRWCKVEPLKGVERIEAQKMTATIENKLVVRRWADMHVTHEIDVLGERWRVTSIEDYGRQGIMILWVQRKV